MVGNRHKGFEICLNRSKNKFFWEEIDVNKFKFKGLSTFFVSNKNEISKVDAPAKYFQVNSNINLSKKSEYITFGKGWDNY